MFLRMFVLIILLGLSASAIHARHRCPKVPAPPGMFGIISSTTMIPSGTTMAAARSSQTSGCESGHSTNDFYVPARARITLFLESSLPLVQQESTQGKGEHLNALAHLAGCTTNEPIFAELLQKNYAQLFFLNAGANNENTAHSVDGVADALLNLLDNTPIMKSRCFSG